MGYTPSRWRSSGKLHIPDIHILRRPVASRPCPRLAQTMPRTPRSRLKMIILCIILPNHELFVSFIHRDFRISLGKMAARRKTSLPSSFCRDLLDAKVVWNALLLQMYDSAPDTWHCSRCTIVLQIHDSAPDVWQYSTCMTVLQMYVSDRFRKTIVSNQKAQIQQHLLNTTQLISFSEVYTAKDMSFRIDEEEVFTEEQVVGRLSHRHLLWRTAEVYSLPHQMCLFWTANGHKILASWK